jgi:hypothetical protein
MKTAYNKRFSVGFTDKQFNWLEMQRCELVKKTGKWMSRADFVRSLIDFTVVVSEEKKG